MIKHYHAKIHKTGTLLKLSYRNGKFFRLETVSGKSLNAKQVENLGVIIPSTEADFGAFNASLEHRVSYSIVVKKLTLYQSFMEAWDTFIRTRLDVPPKFNKAEGNHLSQLVKYLVKIEGDQTKALDLWTGILASWDKLDSFHQKNPDIKYINSNIMRILNNVKTINKGTAPEVFNSAMESEIGRDFKFK